MAAVKYTVANSIIIKIANKPKTNEIISVLFLFFKLNPIKIGKTGKIQGDKIEITPVIKETNRKISINIVLTGYFRTVININYDNYITFIKFLHDLSII